MEFVVLLLLVWMAILLNLVLVKAGPTVGLMLCTGHRGSPAGALDGQRLRCHGDGGRGS